MATPETAPHRHGETAASCPDRAPPIRGWCRRGGGSGSRISPKNADLAHRGSPLRRDRTWIMMASPGNGPFAGCGTPAPLVGFHLFRPGDPGRKNWSHHMDGVLTRPAVMRLKQHVSLTKTQHQLHAWAWSGYAIVQFARWDAPLA